MRYLLNEDLNKFILDVLLWEEWVEGTNHKLYTSETLMRLLKQYRIMGEEQGPSLARLLTYVCFSLSLYYWN